MKKSQIKTRIAPSPTGDLHIGTARTALFNYLFTKQNNGKFIVRIEDTDKERSKKEFEDNILEELKWLGLDNDKLYRQSERTDIYKKYIEKLLKEGRAYLSKEESKAKMGKQIEVVRLKNPNKKVEFDDIIRGKIEFDTTELGNFVIAKNINEPLYHLAVVVDDYEMEISHIIRGEDHISNTPRQILIQEALGIDRPRYVHIPLILTQNRSKMSKRDNATSISEYRRKGYVSDALINYMALLGWNPGTNKELFTINELIEEFSIENIQKGGAIFDIEKLNWFNREYIKKIIWDVAEKEGRGSVLWPIRYALSGRNKSPDPFQLAEVLGK